jgi:hypothetical protein
VGPYIALNEVELAGCIQYRGVPAEESLRTYDARNVYQSIFIGLQATLLISEVKIVPLPVLEQWRQGYEKAIRAAVLRRPLVTWVPAFSAGLERQAALDHLLCWTTVPLWFSLQ